MRAFSREMELDVYREIADIAKKYGVSVDPDHIDALDRQLSRGVEIDRMRAEVYKALKIASKEDSFSLAREYARRILVMFQYGGDG